LFVDGRIYADPDSQHWYLGKAKGSTEKIFRFLFLKSLTFFPVLHGQLKASPGA
jgi:hypothetical protein